METKSDNEIIAKYDGLEFEVASGKWCLPKIVGTHKVWAVSWNPEELEYHTNYEWLMRVWFKFKNEDMQNLDLNIQHTKICNAIAYRITHHSIHTAHAKLVEGIKWYNQQPK